MTPDNSKKRRSAKKRGRQTSATAPQRRENAAGAQAPRR
jgi:hypothetical protein